MFTRSAFKKVFLKNAEANMITDLATNNESAICDNQIQ